MLTMVVVSVFAVSIALLFAWKFRCAEISATSSSVMSTFERSSDPLLTAPNMPSLAVPRMGVPLATVEDQWASPSWRKPSWLLNAAIATWPR